MMPAQLSETKSVYVFIRFTKCFIITTNLFNQEQDIKAMLDLTETIVQSVG